MTILCFKTDWIFVSGVNMLPKADRKKYKEKHDMRAMNCFIGKRVFLPLSIACTISPLFIVFEDTELMKSTWVGILITVAIFAFTASIFYAVAKILGGKFER
jgi:hypothetical protein